VSSSERRTHACAAAATHAHGRQPWGHRPDFSVLQGAGQLALQLLQPAEARQLCQARLDASGIVFTRVVETVVLDMLYQGQTHTVAVPIEAGDYSHEGLFKAFERTYHAQFGRTLSGPAVRVLNLRYSRVGERAKFDLSILAPKSLVVPEVLGLERIFHQGEWLSVPRSARLDWPVGSKVVGPAMLEQADTTIWLEPGFQARVDEWGNLLLSQAETRA
jgi:N-methylhydantoinase A